jgi:transcriptional regulator with XRE-family HTH domain
MQPSTLKLARLQHGWTEKQAATKLGISQSYSAMLESGRRRVTPRLARTFISVYGLNRTPNVFDPRSKVADQELATMLAAWGYPGFAPLKRGVAELNPPEVLLRALSQDELETRLAEANPWILVKYWHMDTTWLVKQAKLNDQQNRLGFVVSLATRMSEKSDSPFESRNEALKNLEETLEKSRLAREDAFLNCSDTVVERQSLQQNRSEEAKHWKLLTSWRLEHLQFDF